MGNRGFTLIELLITIAIMIILASIAIPGYVGQQRRAARTEAFSNLESLRLLEEQYYAENGRYSPDPDGIAYYSDTSTTITNTVGGLPGFRPGDADNLSFSYELQTSNNGQDFTATATGRPGTRVVGESFWINQENNRNF